MPATEVTSDLAEEHVSFLPRLGIKDFEQAHRRWHTAFTLPLSTSSGDAQTWRDQALDARPMICRFLLFLTGCQ